MDKIFNQTIFVSVRNYKSDCFLLQLPTARVPAKVDSKERQRTLARELLHSTASYKHLPPPPPPRSLCRDPMRLLFIKNVACNPKK